MEAVGFELRELLQEVTMEQSSIVNVSKFMLAHAQYMDGLVAIWAFGFDEKELRKKHYLLYLYVANDVMQRSVRMNQANIIEMFEHYLGSCIEKTWKKGDADTQNSMQKMVQIWKSRKIVQVEVYEALNRLMERLSKENPRPNLRSGKSAGNGKRPATPVLLKNGGKVTPKPKTPRAENTKVYLEDLPKAVDSDEILEVTHLVNELNTKVTNLHLMREKMANMNAALKKFDMNTNQEEDENSIEPSSSGVDENVDAETLDAMSEEELELRIQKLSPCGTISWDGLDSYVHDIDIPNAMKMVLCYRELLDDIQVSRNQLVEYLPKFLDYDQYSASCVAQQEQVETQLTSLEALSVIVEAAKKIKKEKERQHQARLDCPDLRPHKKHREQAQRSYSRWEN